MMHTAHTKAFVLFTYLALVFAFVFIVHLLVRRNRIDYVAAFYLTGAVITVGIGSRLCHVWLGMNLPFGYTSSEFWSHIRTVFAWRPYGLMLYLFGALTAHFVIYACGRLVALARAHRLNLPTVIHSVAGTGAMLSAVLMTYALWYGFYGNVIDARLEWERENELATEQYLLDWLREEPDSPHARQLYETHMKEKSNKMPGHVP